MTLIRRKKSRLQRATETARNLQQRLPSPPDLPELSAPEIKRPELPSLPSAPALDVRKRVSRDTGGDTPLLSLAGGLLLGLFVGIIVAVILISRSEDEESSSARHTGITLLPHQGSDAASEEPSTAVTG